MTTLDIALRSMTGMQLVFLCVLLLLRARSDPSLRYAALLPAGLAAFMITSAPMPPGALGAIGLPLTIVCVANPAWFWIFSRAWFDDDYRPAPLDLAAVAAMIAIGLAHELGPFGPPSRALDVAFRGAILAFVAVAVLNVVRGRRADLDEPRRRARIAFAGGVFAYALAGIVLQVAYDGRLPAGIVRANIAAVLVLAVALSVWLARPQVSTASVTPADAEPVPVRAPASQRPVDALLVTRIRHAMEVDHLYRREGLTIEGLAQALGSQEYRARRAINQGLGYRNFNEFLHRYRLDEASVRLRTQRHLPILTIALDVGFGSIGPFNRAFRTRFGCTPSEYRGADAPRGALQDDTTAPGVAAV